ncbi:dipeptidyl-peptidase 3 family protein [Robiginitomaculum antarcticum]|uniref:dipeptidyl-peptidase 3 family protein n=1 Tax=Robiginitomaculum antarcticum TaxID=437507 RepID=UPI000369A674|nr:hypothetical protein [Robiginitomaculum antarcticum]
MRILLASIAAAALIAGCSPKPDETAAPAPQEPVAAAQTGYDLQREHDKIAPVKMDTDTSFLTSEERRVVNLLIEAGDYIDQIYMRQLNPNNPATRETIAASGDDLMLSMFDLHYGVCDTLNEGRVFYGDTPCTAGAGFYPADMTKAEFEAHIDANPDDKAAFTSGYTVIKRNADGTLYAVPYSVEYKEFLVPAAAKLREAAKITKNANLKKFLGLRADALLDDDYFDSEMAWMDLDGPIEVVYGPYEVYDDGLYGYKTAFETFITVKNPEESKAIGKYKDFLKDMEKNLPVEEHYKNFQRGFESPIVAAYQIHGGGDNVPGVQTIAFNLPNDEKVREAKGAKKVILNNVLGAKYEMILQPIGERVLVPDQARLTVKKYMAMDTLFHELSHSLGPGSIEINGEKTTVNAQLKDLYSGMEEGKADVMGVYNIIYMMERGEIPASEKEAMLATYFTGLFRSMRFGIDAAHGKGAAFQYSYFREVGAVEWLPEESRFRIDFAKFEQAISDLTGMVVVLQGNGDYDAVKTFLDKYARLDDAADTVLGKLDDIPYDIRPSYPDKI